MPYPTASFIFQMVALLLGVIQFVAFAILRCERGWEPWIMLAGGAISILGQLMRWSLPVMHPTLGDFSYWSYSSYWNYLGLSVFFSIVGPTLSSIGLLLHALRRRGQADRVAELEAILATIQRS